MARLLFLYFRDMVDAADHGKVGFESYHDNLTDAYKKMDVDEQGKFHQFVSEWMKA